MSVWPSGMELMYVHDDSDTTEDRFILRLSDGWHELDREVKVSVVPVNDEEPRLVRLAPCLCLTEATSFAPSHNHLALRPAGTVEWRWSQEKPGSFPARPSWRRTLTPPPPASATGSRAFPHKDSCS